jgi:uncharacterized protein
MAGAGFSAATAARGARVVLLALLAALALLFAPGRAFAKFEPPPLRSAVVDEAGAIDDAAEARLAARLDALRKERGFAIVVFLPKSLQGQTVEDVAYDTFNTWGVGAEGKDDGVLLVVAPAERKMRIETGKGVGDRITDVQSSRILREVMAPRLKGGDVEGAVDQGTRAIERALTGQDPVQASPNDGGVRTRTRSQGAPMTATQKYVIVGVVAVILLLAIVSRGFRRVLFSILEVLLWAAFFGRGGGGGSGGGGGGGGGGYGGGGGRSGGGGASGGW